MSVLTVPTATADDELPAFTIRSVLPDLRTLASHALPRLAEATLIPLVLFYGAFWAVGVSGALAAALLWSYGCLLHRVLSGRRMPGMLLLATMALTVRTVIALVSGSLLAYFASPVLGTLMVAGIFALSLRFGQPLAERLVGELGILPPELLEKPEVQAHLRRVTMIWAVENVINAGLTMFLLMTQPLPAFLAVKTVLGWAMSGTCIALCGYDFRRMMRRAGHGAAYASSSPAVTEVAVPVIVAPGVTLVPAFA
jgi:uncharacterized membrane protein